MFSISFLEIHFIYRPGQFFKNASYLSRRSELHASLQVAFTANLAILYD